MTHHVPTAHITDPHVADPHVPAQHASDQNVPAHHVSDHYMSDHDYNIKSPERRRPSLLSQIPRSGAKVLVFSWSAYRVLFVCPVPGQNSKSGAKFGTERSCIIAREAFY